jgi:uncharacterized damage-inducible protein DinB
MKYNIIYKYRRFFMFRKIEDFQNAWKYETEETIKLFSLITDEALGQKIDDGGRSLGFLAWHLVCSIGMISEAGLEVDAPSYESEVPDNTAEIIAAFKKGAETAAERVAANWDEETLLIENEMYGEMWAKGTTLFYMLLHHSHHRGQMTVLMRQAGLKVNGIYGPAKEEWAAMGVPAMA